MRCASGNQRFSVASFSPVIADKARRVFADTHIDAEVRPGKQDGAFCYSVLPRLTPYVLLNYNGRARDMATLAHELGHAVHAMMAGRHSVLTFDAAEPLAETASVFGEMLLAARQRGVILDFEAHNRFIIRSLHTFNDGDCVKIHLL